MSIPVVYHCYNKLPPNPVAKNDHTELFGSSLHVGGTPWRQFICISSKICQGSCTRIEAQLPKEQPGLGCKLHTHLEL